MSRDSSIYMHAVVLALFVQLLFGGVISSMDQSAGDGVDGIQIISKKDWSSELEEEFSHTPEYIVVSTSDLTCNNAKQCLEAAYKHDNMGSNFYIGTKGPVYEGKGWNLVPSVSLGGLNEYVLSVVIFESSESKISNNVKGTLLKLLSLGIKLNKTAKGCKYIDCNLIAGNGSTQSVEWTKILPEGSVLKKDEDINLMPHLNHPTVGIFPIVLLEEWSGKAATVVGKGRKVSKIVIAEQGSRCFTNEDCIKNLMVNESSCEGKASNFYIGDTGVAYEGKGWYDDTCYSLGSPKSDILAITFLGSYKNYQPSKTSILALNRLIKLGLWLKIIADNYAIQTIGEFQDYKDKEVGNELLQKVKALSAKS